VINKSRAELLSGAPDAPPIDDLRNLFQLCPNHHTSFDRYEWTLVEERRSEDGAGFWLRHTCASATSADLSALMQTFIRFREPSPLAYSFLLKQLGRFPVPCRVCAQPFVASAIWGHYNGLHTFFPSSLFSSFSLARGPLPLSRSLAWSGALPFMEHTPILLSCFIPLCLDALK